MSAADDELPRGETLARRDVLRYAMAGGAMAAGGMVASSGTVAADCHDSIGCVDTPYYSTKWIYDGASGLFSNGYDKEDTDGMVANNAHMRIWDVLDTLQSTQQGFITSSANYVQDGDALSSPLAALVWSEIRMQVYEDVRDGVPLSDARGNARDRGLEVLSTPARNYVRQHNQMVYDIVAAFLTFRDLGEDWSGADHTEGETNASIPWGSMTTMENGLSHADVFEGEYNANIQPHDEFKVDVGPFDLPNGETESAYTLRTLDTQYDTELSIGVQNSVVYPFRVLAPTDSELSDLDFRDLTSDFSSLFDAIDTIETEVTNDAGPYAENVYNAVSEGDLDSIEILGPTEYMKQLGDVDGMTRFTAEMLNFGLITSDDRTTKVTLSADTTGLEQERTGSLFLRWDWTELETWEWDYDQSGKVLTIDEDSIMSDATYTAVFDDTDNTTVTIAPDDLGADGTYTFSDTAPTTSLLRVDLDAVGELRSFIPTGEAVTGNNYAIFGYEDADGNVVRHEIASEDTFTITAIETDDGEEKDRLQLSGFNQLTRDPAKSLEQAEAQSDTYQDVDELDEAGWTMPPIFGGGSNGILLLLGAAVVLLLNFKDQLI